MNLRTALWTALDGVEKLAQASKWQRLRQRPLPYLTAIGFRHLIYPWLRQGWLRSAATFMGHGMWVRLPAATDVYLTGGKSHPSEIRLARYMIQHLAEGQHLVDVGAHFGYFSLLGASLVGPQGGVLALEAAPRTFALLEKNLQGLPQVTALPWAAAERAGDLTFYEFPTLFSEYNTLAEEQFADERWRQRYRPRKLSVPAIRLDDYLLEQSWRPQLIKIDVEGAELAVVRGLEKLLPEVPQVQVVMEYLAPERSNANHRAAAAWLEAKGWQPHAIGPEGQLAALDDIDGYLAAQGLDSDNLVFCTPHPDQ